MRALILSAGFGKRLLPFTQNTPKPLFPLISGPILDTIIKKLEKSECKEIIINTHFMAGKIKAFISSQSYAVPVRLIYEKTILGTGGAIKNVAEFILNEPLMVINSDVVTDIDYSTVFNFHLTHSFPVTMVLHDCERFNKVYVDEAEFITGFHEHPENTKSASCSPMAFTGIQVVDPEILSYLPENSFSNIIDIYKKRLLDGMKIKAFPVKNHFWEDIGSPDAYQSAIIRQMLDKVLMDKGGDTSHRPIVQKQIKGDGSDRKWYRLEVGDHGFILSDHGIKELDEPSEVDSFIHIGHHLKKNKISVPEIYQGHSFSGLVLLQDLGDINLQAVIKKTKEDGEVISIYKKVIDQLIDMFIHGKNQFNLSWTNQSEFYDKDLVIDFECKYFVNAFLNKYLHLNDSFERYREEFEYITDGAVNTSEQGFIHRDFQSRNIMVSHGKYYFIDFQGGRMGPIQYDLASLLIDPYVALSEPIQKNLIKYSIQRLSHQLIIDVQSFKQTLFHCMVTRNFQILGAYGFLTRVKNKPFFKQFIPIAVNSLKTNLSHLPENRISGLLKLSDQIKACIKYT